MKHFSHALQIFIPERQEGFHGVERALAAVAVAQMRPPGVVVDEPGAENGLECFHLAGRHPPPFEFVRTAVPRGAKSELLRYRAPMRIGLSIMHAGGGVLVGPTVSSRGW